MKNEITIENKGNIIEGFKFLATSHRNLHNERRKYEWKAVFAVITFYMLAVSTFYTDFINNDSVRESVIMIIIVLIIAICLTTILILFLIKLHKVNSINVQIAEYSENNINELINNKTINYLNFKDIVNNPSPRWWAFYYQISTIIVFALLAAGLIILKLIN